MAAFPSVMEQVVQDHDNCTTYLETKPSVRYMLAYSAFMIKKCLMKGFTLQSKTLLYNTCQLTYISSIALKYLPQKCNCLTYII